jgi:integrase
MQAQIADGLTIEGTRTTLEDFMQQWLRTAKSSLRPNTWKQYSQIVRQHIIPDLGRIKLKDLRPDHIQSLYASKQEAGVGLHTIRLIHAVLHRAFAQALRWGLVTRNPADAVDRPKPGRKEMKALDAGQARVLLNAIEGERLEALYYLAITTGLRQGELLGLRWSDLDWETGRLRVQRQLQRVPGEGLVFSEPKSNASRRLVKLGSTVLEKLHEHRERQEQERLLVGERWQKHELIFPSTIGTPMEPRNLFRQFKDLLKRAGLPDIRFHDLRHTAATLMFEQDVHPKVVQERLGHSTITLTLDTYSHVLPSMQEDAADKMDTLLQ